MAKRPRWASQPYPSVKAPVDHADDAAAVDWTETRQQSSERQPGTLWQRKMRTLATRSTRNAKRRHASGAPLKRGAPKRAR